MRDFILKSLARLIVWLVIYPAMMLGTALLILCCRVVLPVCAWWRAR